MGSTGSKFIIHKREELVSKILPNIFKQSKFSSFTRQLNAYGFEKDYDMINQLMSSGVACTGIAYSHQDFQRDDLDACRRISRRRSNQSLIEGIYRLNPGASFDPNMFRTLAETNGNNLAHLVQPQDLPRNIPRFSVPTNEATASEHENLNKLFK
mmetsp:Transcript_11843/g.17381  ORF Transcript_11843/g.17381 Transcript_11843/m.17381 type:complete len:155 (-) Transcript_11843:73-537(-)